MFKPLIKTASVLLVISMIFTACASNSPTTGSPKAPAASESAGKQSKEPIIIGSTMTLTGGAGYLGSGMKEVFDLVVKQTNESGGIHGRQLQMIYYDDEGKPEKALQNVQKLTKKDGVHILLGPSLASTSAAVQPFVDKEKVLMFSTSSAYSAPADSFGFNIGPKQTAMLQIHHDWFLKKGIKKVGYMATTDSSGDISVGIIEKQFQNKDGVKYIIERMGLDEVDVTTQLTRLKTAGIEALVIIGPGAPPAITIKNAGQLKMKIPILLTHSQASRSFAKSIEGFIPDQLFLAGTAPMAYQEVNEKNPLKPLTLKFANDFKAKYNKEVDHVGAIGYDSILMVIKGIEAVGSDDAVKIKEYFETQVKDVPLTTAVTTYSKNDHQGSGVAGALLLKLNPDLSWHVEWEPLFWEK